jgi:hypothetical protein
MPYICELIKRWLSISGAIIAFPAACKEMIARLQFGMFAAASCVVGSVEEVSVFLT